MWGVRNGGYSTYSEGAHPDVLEALTRTNLSQQTGYGDDEFSAEARIAIRQLIGDDAATVYFTPGGTGANLLSIATTLLRPHEAFIAAEPGHAVGREDGCVEATGYKILVEPGADGKLTPEQIEVAFHTSRIAYKPKPKLVIISNTTEVGTVYTKAELEAIAAVCKELSLLLLLDGARLGVALTSTQNDLTLNDIYRLTDVFWIGGTRNGALLGEAVVIKDLIKGAEFPYHMQQRGMLLAKSRLLGIQFSTLLRDDLYFRLARHANMAATEMSMALTRTGFQMRQETESNQVFVIVWSELVEVLEESFDFYIWEYLDNGFLVVRFVTSWATDLSQVERLCDVAAEWNLHTLEEAGI